MALHACRVDGNAVQVEGSGTRFITATAGADFHP